MNVAAVDFTITSSGGLESDAAPPTVALFTPTDNATAVDISRNIFITFSEAIIRGTGTIEIRSDSESGNLVESFNAATSNRLTLSGNQLTIDPTNDLRSSTKYFVVLNAGTVKDAAGNSYAGTSTYDFTTAASSGAGGDPNNGVISGDGSANILAGGSGNDIIVGNAGIDRFNITAGIDSVLDLGKGGADVLNVSSGATVDAMVVAKWTASAATINYGTANLTTNGFAVNLAAVTVGNGFNVTNVLAKKIVLTGSALGDSLTGNIGKDQLIGNAGADTLVGGQGADKLRGGIGSDTFEFSAGDSGQAKNFDIVLDYTKGQVGVGDAIDYSANLTIGGTEAAATSTQASINSITGVASFFPASGSSIADALADISASFTAAGDAAGEFALFQIKAKGDYYLFISDGVAGVSTGDVVVRLAGVTSIGSIDLTDGNLTIVA